IAKVRLTLQWLAHKPPGPTVRARSHDHEIISAQEKAHTIHDRRRAPSLGIHRYRLRWCPMSSEVEQPLGKTMLQLLAGRIRRARIDRDRFRLPVARLPLTETDVA
ncbi:MAG TPA: hypothetical protein VGS80_26550, partial [Ktedonobacterales bacterium]|nr:hypothetical protein [Ktedonobacterales bacterium]